MRSKVEGWAGSERLQTLANHFRPSKPPQLTNFPKRAAVLVCIFQGDGGDLRVILTKRSSNLSTHSGDVALPGGKADEGDANDVETALREAHEEIGLDPSLVNVVTVLHPFFTKSLGVGEHWDESSHLNDDDAANDWEEKLPPTTMSNKKMYELRTDPSSKSNGDETGRGRG
ncbi:hypothetical protein F8388_019042 [Cannabis sativa]|uniref:Nudix hydrolase domain-containing protein n=1 Tax=Cannabis sativa TaxID=3483 RepID=A0A7J6H125_CANSA|nr:hypothetical protein F8388_019042 [Cannabis sativa]